MKKVILLLILLLHIQCSNSNLQLTNIAISDPVAQFGDIKWSDTLHYNFLIRNIGTNNLVIKKVSPSCDCVKYSWTQEEIPPNKFGYLSVTIKPKEKEKGQSVQTIVISTNTLKVFSVLKVLYCVN